MAGVQLDPNGRLLRLYAIPPRQAQAPPTPADPDWVRWFDPQTLGFALTELQLARPEWAPPCACDRQAAWTGAAARPPRLAGAGRGRGLPRPPGVF